MTAMIALGIFALVYILDNFRPSQNEVYNAISNDWIMLNQIKERLQDNGITNPSTVIINHHLQNLEIDGYIEWQRITATSRSLVYRRRQPNNTPTSALFS